MSGCIYTDEATKYVLPVLPFSIPLVTVPLYCSETENATKTFLTKLVEKDQVHPFLSLIKDSGVYLNEVRKIFQAKDRKTRVDGLLYLIIDKYTKKSGISLDTNYVFRLVKDSGINLKDVAGILTAKNRGGVAVLVVYSLLGKVQKKGLMSDRYVKPEKAFVPVVKKLVWDGTKSRIAVDMFEAGARGTTIHGGSVYFPDKDNLKAVLPKNAFKEPARIMLFESFVLHELYHTYQDYLELPLKKGMIESQGHLARGDFIYHAYRKYASETWMRLDYNIISKSAVDKGLPSVSFAVPRAIVERLIGENAESSQLKKELTEIAENYLNFDIYMLLYDTDEIHALAEGLRQGARANNIDLDTFVSEQVSSFKNLGKREHLQIDFTRGKSNASQIFMKYIAATLARTLSYWYAHQDALIGHPEKAAKKLQAARQSMEEAFKGFVKYTELSKLREDMNRYRSARNDGIKIK